ncbi:putative GPI-anchored protein [Vitis vinifera]|uniref:Putative GPI-anchored protein n=1 Tax=Vitis vinifera TaxID=29760 RepID=A0A438JG45_VITVI|nr:putative GPI-anchored protein [Vitis vinifera]
MLQRAVGNGTSNQTACCSSMERYVSHLQKQSLITNLQALDCAASLGMKLQKANITRNIYNLCRITLKDFSLQESGCLLPSLPSDATLDKSSGISFICDLNDNIPAPWPSSSQLPASSCNKSMAYLCQIPALPAVASAQSDAPESVIQEGLKEGIKGYIISSALCTCVGSGRDAGGRVLN